MEPELKQAWLTALRSGRYKQGTGVFRRKQYQTDTSDSFCVIGVLMDVIAPDGWSHDGFYWNNLPACEKLGMPSEKDWGGVKIVEDGIRLNDRKQLDFQQCANIIEAEW